MGVGTDSGPGERRTGIYFLICIISVVTTFQLGQITRAAVHSVEPGASISETLNLAAPGDTVIIEGYHVESAIVVDKPVTIIGKNSPVIDGNHAGPVMTVTASGVRISGLEIRGTPVSFIDDHAGLLLESVSDCVITGNRFMDNFFAVYLAKASNCYIADNVIVGLAESETTSGNGIHLWYCRDIEISGNDVRGHRDGIYFEFVKHSRIINNYSTGNLRYGLHFMFSDSCQYRGNQFIDNGAGVAVMYTHAVTMTNNRFEKNQGPSSYGLLLKEISDSEVRGNTIRQNTIGIYMEGCNRVSVLDNDIVENGWGLKIMANAIDTKVTRNNFSGNSFQVATNSRQNFSTFDGNYWSNYRGYDLDRDGTGDVPFRPVSLFSLIVQKNPPSLILLRSLVSDALNLAEQIMPSLTPETLVDHRPAMKSIP